MVLEIYESQELSAEPVLDKIAFDDLDILEIGCGTGDFTRRHLTGARYLLCVEEDELSVAAFQEAWLQVSSEAVVDLHQASILDLPLPSASFDMVIFSNSF